MAAPPVAPPRPAAPPAAPVAAPQRKDELGSVTVIDRIPIPEPPPAVLQAAKLERARPAGFWIRFLAYLIDALPMFVIAGAATALTWTVSTTLGMLVNLLILPYCAYDFVVMPAQKATTFGKKALGLLIVHPSVKAGQGLGWSVAIIRVLGQFVSSILLGVGYLIIGFTSQKQGLHDMIANTRVVRVR